MITTATLTRAQTGMTVDQLASVMRHHWRQYLQDFRLPDECPDALGEIGPNFLKYDWLALKQDLRDCGWCLAHIDGDKALRRAHDLAIAPIEDQRHQHDFSLAIDRAFDGIAGWWS